MFTDKTNDVLRQMIRGRNVQTTKKRPVLIGGTGGGGSVSNAVFAVTLAYDSGANYDSGTGKATWTYTVKEYGTSTVLKHADNSDADTMTPIIRQKGKASAATSGAAMRNSSGDVVLLEAYEELTTILVAL